MHRHTRCMGVGGVKAPSGRVIVPPGSWVGCYTSETVLASSPGLRMEVTPALLPAGETPTDKGNTQANLSVYTHAPKTHTNAKQQGGISIRVFHCGYVYRLLYVREWFVGEVVCIGV